VDDFMMGPDKPQTHAIASFSCCKNIKGNPQNFRELPQPRAITPTFSSGSDFMMGLGKRQLYAKYEFAGFISYGNIN